MFQLARPEPWTQQALCKEVDPDLWFADKGEWDRTIKAKVMCRRCPVRAQCLQHALDNNEVHGVWGGLSPQQRLEFRQRNNLPPGKRHDINDWHGTAAGAKRHYRLGTKVCQRCREAEKLARLERRSQCG